MINIPLSVRIDGVDYQVKYTDNPIIDNSQVCYGHIDFDKKEILIKKNMQDPQGEQITLLHEIIHGIVYEREFDYTNNNEETITEETARGLYQVIRDNPGLFK